MTFVTSTQGQTQVPPGPSESFHSAQDLFVWLNDNFSVYGEIFKASIYGSDVYVVSNPEYCEYILRGNWRNYRRSGLVVKRIALSLGPGLIASNGELWTKQRRMLQPSFAKSAMGDCADVMRDANVELIDAWKAAAERREAVNVTKDVSAMVLKITLMALFGDDYDEIAPHFAAVAEPGRDLEFTRSLPLNRGIILDVIARRRRKICHGADILGRMIDARDRPTGEAMPDGQLVREALTVVIGGSETTAAMLNWTWCLLSHHPEVESQLSEELERKPWVGAPTLESMPNYVYTRQVIDEALRLYPPLWLMTRRALQDDHLGEYFVPAGTEIYISPHIIQRNPWYWEVPEQFDPDRMNGQNLAGKPELASCPFGAGPRNCIGEWFARAEIQMHLMMAARELRLLDDDASTPEVAAAGINLLSKNDFVMRPQIKRRPTA